MKKKKGQIDLQQAFVAIVMIIFLFIALSVVTLVLNSISLGNIESSFDSLINAFIPLFILAIIFEIIRRIIG